MPDSAAAASNGTQQRLKDASAELCTWIKSENFQRLPIGTLSDAMSTRIFSRAWERGNDHLSDTPWPDVRHLALVRQHLDDGVIPFAMSEKSKTECLDWLECAMNISSLFTCMMHSAVVVEDENAYAMWDSDADGDFFGVGATTKPGFLEGTACLGHMAEDYFEKMSRPCWRNVPPRLLRILRPLVDRLT